MRRIKRYLGIMAWLLVSTCCTNNPLDENNGEDTNLPSNHENASADASGNLLDFDINIDTEDDNDYTEIDEVLITDSNDENYEDFIENSTFSSVVTITYSGSTATIDNPVSGVTVTQEGAHITINSEVKKVEYLVTGTTTDGSLKIYSSNKFKLSLNGINMTNPQGSAINIQSGKRCFVVVKEETENILEDASSYTSSGKEDEKGCFFSEGQLIFSGSGSLTVTGNYKHGICSDEYLRFRKDTRITVSNAAKDALHANDKIIIGGGTLYLTAKGDGIECEKGAIDMTAGCVTVNSMDDALVASYEDTDTSIISSVNIRGGLLKVNTSGEKGMGIKCTGNILISGGIIQAQIAGAGSKGISSDGNLNITDGKITILTSGDALYEDNDLTSAAGVKCDGTMTVSGGELAIKSTGAAGKGINCDGAININAGTVKIITTGKQYIYGRLDSSAKGIKSDGNLTINGGTIWVRTSGGEGSEGIESKSTLTINDGEVAVYAYDDCLNASKHIAINGGKIYCYSSGNDGIDSNGTLTITGGVTIASGTNTPENGFDCDQNTFTITGGTILGIGGGSSTPTSSVCTQRSVIYGGTGSSGQYFCIQSDDEKNILVYKIPRNYSQMTILFSSPELTNANYTIHTGGTLSGGSAFYGLYTDCTYTPGSKITTFTSNSILTQIGNTNGGFNGGGLGGGPNKNW